MVRARAHAAAAAVCVCLCMCLCVICVCVCVCLFACLPLCVFMCVSVCACVRACVLEGDLLTGTCAAVVRFVEPFGAANLNFWVLWESNVVMNIALPVSQVRACASGWRVRPRVFVCTRALS
jgi:hypothetical protein